MKTSTAGKISTTVTISVAVATLAVAGLSGCSIDPQYSNSGYSRPVYGSSVYFGPETGARGAYAPGNDSYYSPGYEYYPSRQSGYYPGPIYIYSHGYRR